MFSRPLKVVSFALSLLAAATCATAGEPKSHVWSPSSQSFCKLHLDRVYQANQGQPIHLVITNTSKLRLQYKVSISVVEDKKPMSAGEIVVDNANAGEQSDRGSSMAYSGLIDETSRVLLRVTSCSKRS